MQNIQLAAKTRIKKTTQSILLREILQEIRALRSEVILLFPKESLEEYKHPGRIKRAYQKAIEQYPPMSLWK